MSESEIYLTALLEGNNKIISKIYTKFYPKVASYILRNNGREEEIQDVFQDALMYLIITHRKKSLKISSFGGYFFTVCKNMWKTSIKNKNKRVIKDGVVPLVNKETELSIHILEQQRLEFYQEMFQKLSSNCKEILGNYFNGMSYQEILEDLSYSSINTVRQRVFKCKAKLIQLIKKDSRYNIFKV
ncbi:MAG: RNA polymerase sigma factor [Polaribacter sp.]